MDLAHLSLVAQAQGTTLTPEELSHLEIAFVKRHVAEPSVQMRFWGKIEGSSGAYVVAVGVSAGNAPYLEKKFYFFTLASPELQVNP